MSPEPSARLDIVRTWANLNGMLIELVDFVPEERMEWSPKPELWTFRHLFLHLAEAREQWMNRAIADGEPDIDIYKNVHSKDEIKAAFRQTWQRIERVFTDHERLDHTYKDKWWDEAPLRDGHWVAFHLLEHDIHHRADILLYLALLGIETPGSGPPDPHIRCFAFRTKRTGVRGAHASKRCARDMPRQPIFHLQAPPERLQPTSPPRILPPPRP